MCAFLANQERKDRFLNNILDRKEYFLDQKSEVSKSDVLPCGFFMQTKVEKIVFSYSEQKRILFRAEK